MPFIEHLNEEEHPCMTLGLRRAVESSADSSEQQRHDESSDGLNRVFWQLYDVTITIVLLISISSRALLATVEDNF